MSERKAKLVWALPNEEEEKKRSFLTDENNENEWICHHISDSDLKSRKSKVSITARKNGLRKLSK